jgi:hypothetical protein
MNVLLVVTAALVVGFAAGFVTFKAKLRWCPGCGAFLRCPDCPERPLPLPATSETVSPGRYGRAAG